MFAIFLSLVGYLMIIPLSMGNNAVARSPGLTFIAFILAAVYTILPILMVDSYRDESDPIDTKPEETVTTDHYYGAQIMACALGGICCLIIFYDFVLALALSSKCNWHGKLLVTSVARGGGRSKRAATRKINKLLKNASSMHSEMDSSNDSSNVSAVMINYVMSGETFENCGGLAWTWKQIITRDLFEQEGIWIMSRLVSHNAVLKHRAMIKQSCVLTCG